MGAFSTPVNVAIDEHDHPYYGADSRYLIVVGSSSDPMVSIPVLTVFLFLFMSDPFLLCEPDSDATPFNSLNMVSPDGVLSKLALLLIF